MQPTKTIKIYETVLERALIFRGHLLDRLGLVTMSTVELISWLVTRGLDAEEKKGD